eukprot:TRINITY_DN8870_c0_g1_i1.p3 TRINITY_DN8870_c0_g1~~TRINITY_DN8870_c0_g1_i1.p3  ORF type:complete len:108 (-),score=1.31 TRINITY_DN8870_c0_g1_i1:8-331(-)
MHWLTGGWCWGGVLRGRWGVKREREVLEPSQQFLRKGRGGVLHPSATARRQPPSGHAAHSPVFSPIFVPSAFFFLLFCLHDTPSAFAVLILSFFLFPFFGSLLRCRS